jgi:hypothetical protein
MSVETPIASYDVPSGLQRGARFTLFANRLVYFSTDVTETIPLAHLASVRVGFERDLRKLNWAIGLVVVALILASLSGPLSSWMASLTAKLTAAPEREGLENVLISAFSAVGALARLMMPVAVLTAGGAIALAVFFWIGRTTLTLSFAATERECRVRGRDHQLMSFADFLGEQLAARKN